VTYFARVGVSAFAVVVVLASPAAAQPVNSTRVATGFSSPVFATSAPGDPGALYVVEQGGLIRTLNTATGQIGATPFLNLGAISGTNLLSGGEQGLLGLAFHPNYQTNGLFYVNYTTDNGTGSAGATRVEEYRASAGVVDPASRRTIIQFNQPFTNHNGGWIGFNPANGATGPNSGHLYIMSGDGGSANDPQNNAQNTNVLLGKVLRIDVNTTAGGNQYGIPAGNMTGTGVRPELYSYGLRNPWRASFDRANGNLYIGDVGQGAREEVNFIANGSPGGQNFGWRLREGTIQTPAAGVGGPRPPGNVDPIFDYDRSSGGSITGGYVYRGPDPALDGTYFFADFVSSRIWSFRYDGTTVTNFQERTGELQNALNGGSIANISSFAEDGVGNLYILDYFGGEVFRINPVPEPASVGLVAAAGLAGWLACRRRTSRRPGHRAAG
jgi:glucose/arabinose dehydrogenase